MKKIVKILILCLSCIGACWLLPACSSAIEEPESGGGGDGSTVTLTIQAAVPDGTRADDSEVPEREKIDKLRIIVVDQTTHKVEHNQLHGFSYPEDEYKIEVEKNSTKDVYFLANAEDWCSNFPKVGEIYNPDEDESEGDESDDDIIVAKTTTMPSLFNQEITDLPDKLPYTSKYEIKVEDKNVTATCYIAIAAVKFSLDFTNKTGNKMTVQSLKILRIADRSYLLPHLNSNEDWDEWITSVTSNDNDPKPYITAYSIPKETQHNEFEVKVEDTTAGTDDGNDTEDGDDTNDNIGNISDGSSFNVANNGTYKFAPFYCHESKFILQGETKQYYSIQFEINDKRYYEVIEGLESLIRSTHVIIHININKLDDKPGNIVVWGTITPWTEDSAVEGGLEEVTPEP